MKHSLRKAALSGLLATTGAGLFIQGLLGSNLTLVIAGLALFAGMGFVEYSEFVRAKAPA